MNGIKIIRLFGDSYIIGKPIPTVDGGRLTLEDPREVVLVPQLDGSMKMGFRPICFLSKKQLKETSIPLEQIWYEIDENDIPKELADGYVSLVSGISIATPQQVNAVNSSGNVII